MNSTSQILGNSASSLTPPISETRHRHRRYQDGSLGTERRRQCPHPADKTCPNCVRIYRFFEYVGGKKIRRKKILGTIEELPTKDDAKRASEPYRLRANAEHPRPNATMRAFADLFMEKVLRRSLSVPIGGVQDPHARRGYKCADSYRCQLRNWILPKWKDYLVSDFERPEIWSAAEEWFESLLLSQENPGGLAPTTVKLIYATMGQLTKYAMKWGYLSLNPFAGKVGQERRIDPPPGSTKRLHKAAQLTPAQISELLLHLGVRERAAVDFSAWLEPRGSETFALKWMDLDLTAAVVEFSRGIDAGRITEGKTSASNTKMPLPDEVVRSLLEWQSVTPYNKPGDWVFASPKKKGMMPISRYGVIRDYIQPIARKLGLPHVTWYSFRHSLNALAKESISREERQVMLRHGRTSTEEGYGEVPLERKRAIAQRLWTRMRKRLRPATTAGTASPNGAIGHNGSDLPDRSQASTSEPSPVADPIAIPAPTRSSVDRAPDALEHEKRSASARKAWVTIRANRAAKKAAAPQGRRDPGLTQNSRSGVA
jgi:integrase